MKISTAGSILGSSTTGGSFAWVGSSAVGGVGTSFGGSTEGRSTARTGSSAGGGAATSLPKSTPQLWHFAASCPLIASQALHSLRLSDEEQVPHHWSPTLLSAPQAMHFSVAIYSTVTDFARLRGLSTSVPRTSAV
jgi:hypothetical protein